MASSKIDLCSRALVKCGMEPISSLDDGSAEADVANTLYDSVRDGLLSMHPWSFARGQVTLAQLDATPVADYEYAYQLPNNFLRALSVGSSARATGRGIPYLISENRLHCDAEMVVLSYIFKPDESGQPPFFNTCLINFLAAEFCLPLTESTSRTKMLHDAAEVSLARSKTIDSQQNTPQRIVDISLYAIRG